MNFIRVGGINILSLIIIYQKTFKMKRIFVTALIAASLVACENADTTDESTVETTETTTSTTTTYTPGEGDVTHRDGKVMVWRNNNWVEADEDVRLDNGVIVYRNGEVKKDNDVVVLRDGEFVNRSGEFFDKTGNAIEDAWDATKRGAKKAGEAVENAAQKVGDKTKEIVNDKDDNN